MAKNHVETLNLTRYSSRVLSTAAASQTTVKSKKKHKLHCRLTELLNDPSGSSVEATLDKLMKERKDLKKELTVSSLIGFVRELRRFKRYKHALALMDWMEKRGMDIGINNQAIRVDLISKVQGTNIAEDYISTLPQEAKNEKTYAALLSNFCSSKMEKKALSLYEKMKTLNLASTSLISNNIMTLYLKLNQPEKILDHFQEMEELNIYPDRVTYGLLMNGYSSLNDMESAERVIKEMEGGGRITPDWTIYCNLASLYNSSGQFEKSRSILKKAEETIDIKNRTPYEFLITSYAAAGSLPDVHRVWNILKTSFHKTTNRSYLSMLNALRKLGDIDGIKQRFEEWESKCEYYDAKVAHVVIKAYLRNGMTEEAENILKRGSEKGVDYTIGMLELFVVSCLEVCDMQLATKYLKQMKSKGWKCGKAKMAWFTKYYEETKEVDGGEEFFSTLKELDCLNV